MWARREEERASKSKRETHYFCIIMNLAFFMCFSIICICFLSMSIPRQIFHHLFKVNENSSDINIFNLAEGFAPFSPQHQFETELSKEEPLSLFDIWLAAPSYQ